MEIVVLRLGHRLPRDERMSTHVCLVARAFGAKGAIYTGQHDQGLEDSVSRVAKQWGGDFSVSYEKGFRSTISRMKKQGFGVVHLTMYGMPVEGKTAGMRKYAKLLIIVGGDQVPGEVYDLADWNVAVTGQPHSEVAALAILLDRLQEGKELSEDADAAFKGDVRIMPQERGKRVVRKPQR